MNAAPIASSPVQLEAVTLDALGTLVRLEDPTPRLQASLACRLGLDVPSDRCTAALRAEMRHYRRHCVEAVDAAAHGRLRLACAGVLADALGLGLAGPELLPCLDDTFAFALYPDVVDALDQLDASGVPLAVVSNWDVSLHETLEALGIRHRFRAVLTSAECGSAKPGPELYRRAGKVLGLPLGRLLHVGDDAATDVDGARATGLSAVLLQREPGADERTPRIRTLRELPALLELGRRGHGADEGMTT